MTKYPDFSNYTLATFNQTLLQDTSLCTLETCPLILDGYLLGEMTYIPSLGGNVFYAIIFALIVLIQVYQGLKYRTWGFLVGMFCGGVLEVIGYVARIIIHNNPFSSDGFIMYLCCLTIAPAFLSAAIYICLSRIIIIYTPDAARFKPQFYSYSFMASDFVSLVLQASFPTWWRSRSFQSWFSSESFPRTFADAQFVLKAAGGAIASTADTRHTEHVGVHVMVAGLAFQVISLAVFAALCADFYLSVTKLKKVPIASTINLGELKENKTSAVQDSQPVDLATYQSPNDSPLNPEFLEIRSSRSHHHLMIALFLATFFIFVRSIFRCAELSGGFAGSLANDQASFMILEGVMIILAMACLTVWHPGRIWTKSGWKSATSKA
ncbi:hypothetical protein BP6252_14009 [Coleophoma cylindrospora]|uniref:Uncharacterized protein n=1 Tax=Coleophoma cylindrospora TaxID=1849047 RepID=A0A3D8Q4F1_9HELO|nr:hypothetical protein BP6252_14009 [Coleophoma cylindrospora]